MSSRLLTLGRLRAKEVMRHAMNSIQRGNVINCCRKILEHQAAFRLGKPGQKFLQIMPTSTPNIDEQDILHGFRGVRQDLRLDWEPIEPVLPRDTVSHHASVEVCRPLEIRMNMLKVRKISVERPLERTMGAIVRTFVSMASHIFMHLYLDHCGAIMASESVVN